MSDTRSIARHFARNALRYERAADVHRVIAERLLELLPADAHPARALEIGCGTGILTGLVSRRLPEALFDALDIAQPMLDAAARHNPSSNVRLICGDALQFESAVRYQLVVSSSAMHWITPAAALYSRLAALMEPGGVLLFSLMTAGTLGELHGLRAELFPEKKPRAELPTVGQVRSDLSAQGFSVEAVREEVFYSYYRDTAALLAGIRDLGVTGGDLSSGEKPLTRGEILRLSELYRSRYTAEDGRVKASFRTGFFRARR